MNQSKPIKVAVIGGGCAAITTAFELTRPEHKGKFQVTVYQLGWRLGGKGASGRGPADRIEEHGLHIWMGFYENAFRLMRECYAELKRDPHTCRIADWRDAFAPQPLVGVMDRSANGDWSPWLALFQPAPGLPGDPLDNHNPFTIASYLARLATLVRLAIASAQARRPDGAGRFDAAPFAAPGEAGAAPTLAEAAAAVARFIQYGLLATVAGLSQAAALLEAMLRTQPQYPTRLVLDLLGAVGAAARRQIEPLIEGDDELRRLFEVIDITLAVITGIVRFGLVTDPRGFDAIDDFELREWLRLNGASERSLGSALLRGIYDLAFAYQDGDPERPNQAAGLAVRGSLRMFFTFRGAFFWRMQSAMGDVVFAPLYEVLKRRGVTFKFFHRLTRLRLADASALTPGERPHVAALEFDLQAAIRDGAEYQPLIDVRGLPCWPSAPDFSQLADGDRIREEGWAFESHWERRKAATLTLRVGSDFDFVVLGVGLGAVPEVAADLLARDQRWRDMTTHVTTVPTQAFQLWMREDMAALGWDRGPCAVSAFYHPFDTWADMSHLIPEESWPIRPRAIAYFCTALPAAAPADQRSPDYPQRRRDEVRRSAIDFLNRRIAYLWPGAMRAEGGYRWELLATPEESSSAATSDSGEARFDTQFWTANVNPSDLYVQSPPKATRHRISPLDNTYDNLTIAGDWTACGLNVGCVEAAVMSGRLAAHALAGLPRLEDIVGYDHP